ncbi:MAG: lipopolysaccharide biosynthesis protein, partial [Flavobacterium sp.]
LIVQIILARVLLPEAFGLIAMLQIFASMGQTLSDGGMCTSLVRTRFAGQKDFSTVFFMNIGISIIVYWMLFFIAPYIASFYQQPSLTLITRVYMLGIIIQAFVAVQTTILNRDLNFKAQVIMQIPSLVLGGAVGIAFAYLGYGVWSIVWMYLARSTIWTVQHWIFTKWTPKLIFDSRRFKTHFNFGYKITLSAILNSVFENSYNLIIGKWFSTVQLGYYNRAYTFRQLPVENISYAINKVTFPMFASIQHDDARLKDIYKRLMQQIVFWTSPLLILCCIVAEPVFTVVLTEKWLPAVPYFQILCIAGILYPLHAYNLNILQVKGRSDLFLKLEVAKKLFIVGGLALSIQFGIYGLLYFQVVSSVVSFFINTFYSGKLLNYSSWSQLKDIFPSIFFATFSGIIVGLVNHYFIKQTFTSDIMIILLDTILFIAVYASIAILTRMKALVDLKELLQNTGVYKPKP